MIAVKVICDTGNTWVTSINGTYNDAREYFMGQTFVREDYNTGAEIPDTVVSVEQVCEQFSPLVNDGDYRGTYCAYCGEKEAKHLAA